MTSLATTAAVRAEILILLKRSATPLNTKQIRSAMTPSLIQFYPGVVDNQLTTMAKNGLVERVRQDGKRTVYWTVGAVA